MLAVNQFLQNRYLIVRKLGEGGMAAVYEARDQRLGNTVALKETKFHEDWLRKAFELEAQLLAKLRHTGLPKVIDHFVEGDGQFLVMEFIPGDDLASRVETNGGAFEFDMVLNWADELLDALQYLHTRQPPIVHRDVKPHNLKLTEEGKIILLDFGLAKTMLSGTIVYGCSNHYSSLEQKRAAITDGRSDLYSAGATLYYLMTGRKPADAESRSAAITSGQADPLLPAAEINPKVTRDVSAVLLGAMALEANDRPANAVAFRRLLNDARESSHAAAQPVVGASPRRIEILLAARGSEAEDRRFVAAQATGGRAQPDRKTGTQVNSDGSLQTTPAAGPRSSVEATIMSKVRIWAARNFLVASAQLVVAVLAIGVTIFLYMHSRASDGKTETQPPAPKNASKPVVVEAMSYHLELKNKNQGASDGALSSDQRFKFHFIPRSAGYLYIVAPGDGNVPMTFLTNRPMPDSGVTTNAVEAGADFQFPNDNWIGLRDDSYQTPFTVIFSPTRLEAPAFLAASAGRTLTLAEQRELDAFLNRHKTVEPAAVAQQEGGWAGAMLSIPAERVGRDPLIFRIPVARK